MISSNHNLWRKLEPDIVAVYNQDQIVVLDFRLVAEKVRYPPDLRGMRPFVPIVTMKFFAIIYQCR